MEPFGTQGPAVVGSRKVPFCTPTVFFITAGLLLLLLVGSTLSVFINANTGGGAGLEATAENNEIPERRSYIIDGKNASAAGSRVEEAKKPPQAGARKTSAPPLRGGSVLCVVGGHWREDYGSLALDGVCDVVLLPFYVLDTGGDTLRNDSHATTQKLLRMAAKSVKTTYGIHVPLRKLKQVKAHLKRKQVDRKLKNYWAEKNIYHYAVLDLRVNPNKSRASDTVGRVFGTLKRLRKIQEKLSRKASRYSPKGQPEAYIILGIHPWVGTNGELFQALRKHLRSFAISCLIARTHLSSHEVTTRRSGCKTSGPAPYEAGSDKRLLGMPNTVAYASKSLQQPTSLAVSFTLCARWYRAKAEQLIGADCLPRTGTAAIRTSGELCSESPELLQNQAVDRTQHTAYSWRKPDQVTYDTADTIRWKLCSLLSVHRSGNLSVALFDVECDDWRGECRRGATRSQLEGAERTRSLRAFMRELRHRRHSNSTGGSCP